MSADFLHNHPQFPELIRIVAQQKGIDPALVEKDYWIMHCLYGLQQLGMTFELKGGTSLSKGFQIITGSRRTSISASSLPRTGT
jgi:predicted nucleotidyltransferase component of viral defense system